ncbi:guanylate kinase [Oceanospirillum linum]|uniref:Guanylate kinase n=1 Tax=Oceanospirillum linum TaxID=966 RepID=A0A1T1HBU0_OCELI|nr:guanylate kinase [Oceanospirillum linum]OOV87328.1 guanylate kinase [Oceanospirillum linum]SEF81626.1 guanylate kinase [Oleiphilus messinensis]SMP19129.1 guanylate kinase [Oceanospirillum linum]
MPQNIAHNTPEKSHAKGTLYIVSAPSGAGKSSLVTALLEQTRDIKVSVSHTTRAPRPGEEDGVNYNFVTVDQFKELLAEDVFLEYAEVFGNFYGTSRIWLEEQLNAGTDIILEIDWQGAQQVRQLMPESIGIFILPPSKEALQERLDNRGQDSADIIAGRMAQAVSEMSHFDEYHYVIINDRFEVALNELRSVIIAQRQLLNNQKLRQGSLISDLLA